MDLPAAAALVARLRTVGSTGSTNADLVAAAQADPAAWPAPSLLVAGHQTAGRGRLGRAWQAEPGDSLAISLLLRPAAPQATWGWLSLAAGAAMTAALRELGVAASAKWPNDVLIGERKVCGVLAEALPGGAGVVLGAGLNHRAPVDRLPVATATSLAVEGGPTDPDLLVAAYLRHLLPLAAALDERAGDAAASGVRGAVLRASGTVGRRVRVSLPDGTAITGEALDIDAAGRIVVGSISHREGVASGDVEHLRYE